MYGCTCFVRKQTFQRNGGVPAGDMPDIDWAILENGQYNEGWKYIHLMPGYMAAVARELKAAKILTVHHSKYALATHPWDEPLKNHGGCGIEIRYL